MPLRRRNASAALHVACTVIKLNASVGYRMRATAKAAASAASCISGAGKAQYGSGSARGEANG
ncbi:hypothetical protein HG421_12025 [Xanthomonas campestris pv. badrii]|uniref:Uncharacterized protein n=1 Tax=Xanthomonas campestris pv. badrii TaxID=149696 RepID=A0A7Z2VBF2_XANCA|nr:hypothetical protein [Xanthomonas campestris]MCC4605142.1 hypothetical protein [Xanthomonas campestris pv. parthenii]QJD68358.1 hypothetical protein HG421_12025 [Xanthomonas campestris pv. badrii]